MADIPILMYHSVNEWPERHPAGPLSLSPRDFRAHLRAMRDAGFRFRSLAGMMESGTEQERTAVLTFDDGYLDNLAVALPILREFEAGATVFVNPAMVSEDAVRPADRLGDCWGMLSWPELMEMERDGVFDIQSHSMSHDRVFVSDRVVDTYSADKFDRYYWVAWLLDPATRQDWNGDVRRFADLIPSGYPIFENDRALAARQFRPSDEFVRAIMEEGPGLDGRLPPNRVPGRQRGQTETEPQYLARIRHEVGSARRILEERLQKRIEFICFPGGAYNAEVLRATDDAGYVGFMRSSRERRGDNRTSLTNALARREVPGKAVGFTRVSVTKELPAGWIRSDLLHYWNARLKVGAFAWPDRYGPALRIVRAGGRAMRSLGWSRAYSGTRLE